MDKLGIDIRKSSEAEHLQLMTFLEVQGFAIYQGSRNFKKTLEYPYLYYGTMWVGHQSTIHDRLLTTTEFLRKYRGTLKDIYD